MAAVLQIGAYVDIGVIVAAEEKVGDFGFYIAFGAASRATFAFDFSADKTEIRLARDKSDVEIFE